ncbi:MAG: hypothetical protein Q4A06_04915 [Cardiobacteriaceae bacterium]|nr:hypothetical protein [Cardiobacteriaceae bacterium]
MRIAVRFASDAFPPEAGETGLINPGIFGKRLATWLVEQLPAHGFAVTDWYPENWGWEIVLENREFPLKIGCRGEDGAGFLCYLSPDKPVIRRGLWRRKTDTRATIARLAAALDTILRSDARIENIVWIENHEK